MRSLSSSSTAAATARVRGDVAEYTSQYINGAWVASANGRDALIDVHDSNTGRVFARAPRGSAADTARAIEAAAEAFPAWAATPLTERVAALERVLAEFESRKGAVGRALERELGAPRGFAEKIQASTFSSHWKAALRLGQPGAFPWREEMGDTVLVKEPIGVVGCITPWNWPLNQIACKIAPAMLAGCTVVLKPSEITPVNAVLVAEVRIFLVWFPGISRLSPRPTLASLGRTRV